MSYIRINFIKLWIFEIEICIIKLNFIKFYFLIALISFRSFCIKKTFVFYMRYKLSPAAEEKKADESIYCNKFFLL